MLGINLAFAGFVLILNGISYWQELDRKVIGGVNLVVAGIIGVNSIIGVATAEGIVDYANSAGGFLFAFNYLLIGIERLLGSNFAVFGWFQLYASLFSLAFGINCIVAGAMIMAYLWLMWFVLWLVGFMATYISHELDRICPYVLIANGLLSTGIPGILMLLQII